MVKKRYLNLSRLCKGTGKTMHHKFSSITESPGAWRPALVVVVTAFLDPRGFPAIQGANPEPTAVHVFRNRDSFEWAWVVSLDHPV